MLKCFLFVFQRQAKTRMKVNKRMQGKAIGSKVLAANYTATASNKDFCDHTASSAEAWQKCHDIVFVYCIDDLQTIPESYRHNCYIYNCKGSIYNILAGFIG